MNDQRTLLVGYDLSDDYTQISCYNNKYYEAESVCADGNDQFLIPTALAVREDTKDWVYGEEAVRLSENKEGVLVDHLVSLAKQGESVTVYDINFVASNLLEKFFRKTLSLLKKKYPGVNILQMVVTVEYDSEILRQNIYTALENLGIQKDRVVVKSHACCAMYYALSQSKELWMNDVGVFHYDGNNLEYHHICINRKTRPYAVTVTTENFTDSFGQLSTEESKQIDLAQIFLNLARTTLRKSAVSTLYITGKGFEGSWIDPTLQELCMGRRVFKGQNLYTKGACYLSRELKGEGKLADYIFLGEDMIHTSVWLTAYVDAKIQEVELLPIGSTWNEVNESVEMILDGKLEVAIHTKSLFARDTNTFKLCLDDIKSRPNKMTRVLLSIKCKNKEYLEAKLTDLGFGEMIASSNQEASCLIPLV